LLTIEEVTPSCAALFGWAFSPAIRDLDPPPAVAATVGWRGRGPPRPGQEPSGRCPGLTDRGRHLEADYALAVLCCPAPLGGRHACGAVRHDLEQADPTGQPGGIIQDSAYSAVWAETRMEALIPGPVSVCALDSQDAKPDAHDEGDEGDEQAS
jgi:hypothetical protein